jgi:hypothetical protein
MLGVEDLQDLKDNILIILPGGIITTVTLDEFLDNRTALNLVKKYLKKYRENIKKGDFL